MANTCYVEGKVWAKSEAKIRSFLTWLREYKMLSVAATEDIQKLENGLYSQEFIGDCKWSIESSINSPSDKKGDLTTKTDGIIVELWSQEPGCGFEEHYIVENGSITTNDAADWTVVCIDDFEDEAEMADRGFTKEDFDGQDWCQKGGFEDWGEFAIDVTPDLFE